MGPQEGEDKDVPKSILVAAIYLHFVHCVHDFPFAISVLHFFPHFHENMKSRVICGFCFFVDAIVVPSITLVVGSLYLCTSVTSADVIINSCAVAFISNIDNWILVLNLKMNKLGGNASSDVAHLPEQ